MKVRTISTLCLLFFAASLAAQDTAECVLFPTGGILRAESLHEDLGEFRLTCTGSHAVWPAETMITLSLQFSTPVHEDSKPMLRTHDMLPDEEGHLGIISDAAVTWTDVPFPRANTDGESTTTRIKGLAVDATKSSPDVTVFLRVSSAQATVSVPTRTVHVSRILQGLRAKVTDAAAIRTCESSATRSARVEIAEGFLSAFSPNNILFTSNRGVLEGPQRVAVDDLEFRRVDGLGFPQSGRLMYAMNGAADAVLEAASFALEVTDDEGEAGEDIHLSVAYVPREDTDDEFVKSATLVVATFEACETTLAFPFVSNRFGFDTAIVISNMSEKDGSCAIQWNDDDGPSLPVAAQSQAILHVSESNPDFQGYLVASCNFEGALGYAYITAYDGSSLSYLAMVDPN